MSERWGGVWEAWRYRRAAPGPSPRAAAESPEDSGRPAWGGGRGAHVPFLELQGYVLARIGDVAQARRAFAAGYEAQSSFCEVGLALLDYRQKRVGDARQKLAQLSADPSRGADRR